MKTVVITGSTRGIGLGLAENFLVRGCRVVISGRKQNQVDQVVAELAARHSNGSVAGKACDISQVDEIRALWDHAKETFQNVDIWVNNAGISIRRAPLHQQSHQDVETLIQTNFIGLMLANQVALVGMHSQGFGQIWNMEGFGSNGQSVAGMAAYGASKRAVNYLNQSLQKEVKGSQVQVCTLSPGIVVTQLLTGDYDLKSEEWKKAKKLFNVLGDTVETVTPFLVDGVLAANKSGSTVKWLTNRKALWRFMTAAFNKRDLFKSVEDTQLQSTDSPN